MFTYPVINAGRAATASVEYVELTTVGDVSSYDVTTNLTKGQVYTNCVPFMSRSAGSAHTNADDMANRHIRVDMVDNAGTPAVRVRCAQLRGPCTIGIYVVEFNPTKVKVQQIEIAAGTGTGNSGSIEAVDPSRTFALAYGLNNGTGALDDADSFMYRLAFLSTTSIGLYRVSASDSQFPTFMVYVAEALTGGIWSVQHKYIEVLGAATSNTAAISEVDHAATFNLTSFACDRANYYDIGAMNYNNTTTTTQVWKVNSTSYNLYANVQVVSLLDGSRVQRQIPNQTLAATNSQWSVTGALSSFDTSRSVAFTGNAPSTGWPAGHDYISVAIAAGYETLIRPKITDTNTLTTYSWENSANQLAFSAYAVEWVL